MTETLIAGIHPAAFPANFGFIPNPALRPEIGKNKEIGLNLRYDDILFKGDGFRGKAIIIATISMTSSSSRSSPGRAACGDLPILLPVPEHAIRPVGGLGIREHVRCRLLVCGSFRQPRGGRNLLTGVPLLKVPPDQYLTTLGVRMFDRKLTVAVRWLAVNAKDAEDIPNSAAITGKPDLPPTNSYNVVNLYAGYSPVPDVTAAIAVDNLFNVQYAPYMNAMPAGTRYCRSQVRASPSKAR